MTFVSTGGHEDAAPWGLDAETGALRFRQPIDAQWKTYCSTTPQGDGLSMNGGACGGACGFNAESGATKWVTSLAQCDRWTPAVDDRDVQAFTTQLDILNRKTGKVVATIPDPRFDSGAAAWDALPCSARGRTW